MRLRRVARFVSGAGFPDRLQGGSTGLPFLKVSDLRGCGPATVVTTAANYVDVESARTLRATAVPAMSVLLPKIGAAIQGRDRRVLVGTTALFDNNVLGIVPVGVESRYLAYALHIADLRPLTNPGAVASLDLKALGQYELPVEARDCQRQVADFLDRECARVDALRATFSAQRGSLDELRSVVTREAVAGLRRVPLKYAASVVDCKHRTADYVDVGLPLISTREVSRGALIVDEATRRVSAKDFVDLRGGGRDPRRGDIIYSRNASVGVAAYLSEDIDVCMGQDVVLITRRPNDSELLSHVLNWAVADQVVGLSIGSTFSRINVATLRQLVVPSDDPIEESAALGALLSEYARLDALDSVLMAANERLVEYRDALIAEAVSGELDVSAVSGAQMDERSRAVAEGAVAVGPASAPVG